MRMKRTLIIDCLAKIGENVAISGWVQTVRSHGKIAFLDVRDRTGIIQIGAFGKELAEKISKLNQQDVVEIHGIVKQREQKYINVENPVGSIELELTSLEILSKAAEMPFDMGGKDLHLQLPTLLDFRTLSLRHPTVFSIFKVQAEILAGFRKTAEKLSCIEVVVPTIAAGATEGGAEVFTVDYFGHTAYLTQSPQLYKQMMVPVFERVYTIAHAYRAEPSVTTRHLTEATQIDCEFGFVTFEDLLDLIEKVGVETLTYAQEKCSSELEQFGVPKIAASKIPRLTLREAQEILYKETGRDVRQEKDLSPEDESDICKWALKTYNSDFVTITHYPTLKRAFYTMPDPKDPEYSLSYDFLFRGMEILSGSQRIHNFEELYNTIISRGLDPKNFELYLQAFKYGMPPEGGFSFGLERLTMKLLELHNIREASLFPRDLERVDERLSVLFPQSKREE